MSGIRQRIENAFELWARSVVRHPWLAIVVMLCATLFLATRLPLLQVETSSEDYLFDGDPAKIAYNALRDQFGRDQLIYVVIEPPEVFDFQFLEWLRDFHRDFEASVPHLDDVTSLVNARSVYGEGDQLFVDDLMREWPANEEELASLRERVLGTPSYQGALIADEGRVTSLTLKSYAYSDEALGEDEFAGFDEASVDHSKRRVLSAVENGAFCRAAIAVVERHQREGIRVHMTGQPLVAYALTRSMATDIPVIFGGALLIVGSIIILLFRRLSPIILSTTVVVMSLVSTLGVAQLLGFPISLPTQILPSFLLAVGVGYVVHLLTIFFRALSQESDRAAALVVALRHVGPPILMTAVTTIAGLVSFVAASMEQAYQLGITGAVGVMVTVLYTLILVPALLVIVPLSAKRNRSELVGGEVLLSSSARLAIHHPKKVVAATGLLALISIALLPRLDYSADPMKYFPEDHWLRIATLYADEKLGGMQSLEVVVDTGRVNGLHEVEVLDRIESLIGLQDTLRAEGELVSRSWSMLDVLKETHQALNENRSDFYRVPRDPMLVAQELLLFENSGSDDLEDFVDSEFSKARISILTGWEDGVEKQRFIDRVGPRMAAEMGGEAEVTLTGSVAMIARTASASSESLIRSYSLALLLITPLMMFLIGSLRAGLISMVPNLVPILAALAGMVIVGVELDMFTILGACIAIGLAVDDSIHFIVGFRRHFEETGDAARSVELTMESTGRALLFTSLVLVAGFGVLGFSSMANLGWLGLSTAFAIGLAFVLDVTATPALLMLTHRKVASKQSAPSRDGL